MANLMLSHLAVFLFLLDISKQYTPIIKTVGYVGHLFKYDFMQPYNGGCRISVAKLGDSSSGDEELPLWVFENSDEETKIITGIPDKTGTFKLIVMLFGNHFGMYVKLCETYYLKIEIRSQGLYPVLESFIHQHNITSNRIILDQYLPCLIGSKTYVLSFIFIVEKPVNFKAFHRKGELLSSHLNLESDLLQIVEHKSSHVLFKQLKSLRIHAVNTIEEVSDNQQAYTFSWPVSCASTSEHYHKLYRRSLQSDVENATQMKLSEWHLTSGTIRERRETMEVFFSSISAIVGTPVEETSSVTLVQPTKMVESSVIKTDCSTIKICLSTTTVSDTTLASKKISTSFADSNVVKTSVISLASSSSYLLQPTKTEDYVLKTDWSAITIYLSTEILSDAILISKQMSTTFTDFSRRSSLKVKSSFLISSNSMMSSQFVTLVQPTNTVESSVIKTDCSTIKICLSTTISSDTNLASKQFSTSFADSNVVKTSVISLASSSSYSLQPTKTEDYVLKTDWSAITIYLSTEILSDTISISKQMSTTFTNFSRQSSLKVKSIFLLPSNSMMSSQFSRSTMPLSSLKPLSSTGPASSAKSLSSIEPASSIKAPTSTETSTSTQLPSSTAPSSSIKAPSSTEQSSSTQSLISTEPSSSTQSPSSTEPSSSFKAPSSTELSSPSKLISTLSTLLRSKFSPIKTSVRVNNSSASDMLNMTSTTMVGKTKSTPIIHTTSIPVILTSTLQKRLFSSETAQNTRFLNQTVSINSSHTSVSKRSTVRINFSSQTTHSITSSRTLSIDLTSAFFPTQYESSIVSGSSKDVQQSSKIFNTTLSVISSTFKTSLLLSIKQTKYLSVSSTISSFVHPTSRTYVESFHGTNTQYLTSVLPQSTTLLGTNTSFLSLAATILQSSSRIISSKISSRTSASSTFHSDLMSTSLLTGLFYSTDIRSYIVTSSNPSMTSYSDITSNTFSPTTRIRSASVSNVSLLLPSTSELFQYSSTLSPSVMDSLFTSILTPKTSFADLSTITSTGGIQTVASTLGKYSSRITSTIQSKSTGISMSSIISRSKSTLRSKVIHVPSTVSMLVNSTDIYSLRSSRNLKSVSSSLLVISSSRSLKSVSSSLLVISSSRSLKSVTPSVLVTSSALSLTTQSSLSSSSVKTIAKAQSSIVTLKPSKQYSNYLSYKTENALTSKHESLMSTSSILISETQLRSTSNKLHTRRTILVTSMVEVPSKHITSTVSLQSSDVIHVNSTSTKDIVSSMIPFSYIQSSSVVMTTKKPDTPPQLISSIGTQFASTGRLFQFHVPATVFNDSEDGDTRHLKLQATVTRSNWLTFNTTSQTFIGVPLWNDYKTQPSTGLVVSLIAFDIAGNSETDSFSIYIKEPMKSLTFVVSLTLSSDYNEFLLRKRLRADLLERISRFYGKAESADLYISSIDVGSTIINWSNTSLGVNACARESIKGIIDQVQVPHTKTPSEVFSQFLLPEFPLIGVSSQFLGPCVTNTTIAPVTIPIVQSRNIEYMYYVIPIAILGIILLIVLIVVLLFWRRNKKKDGVRRYEKGRPALFSDEIELKTLPNELPKSYIGPYNNDEVDGGESISSGSSYSSLKIPAEPPPTYVMPPPYQSPIFHLNQSDV